MPCALPTGLSSSCSGGSPSSLHCGRPAFFRNSSSGGRLTWSSGGRNSESAGICRSGSCMCCCRLRPLAAAPPTSSATTSALNTVVRLIFPPLPLLLFGVRAAGARAGQRASCDDAFAQRGQRPPSPLQGIYCKLIVLPAAARDTLGPGAHRW
ncbi:MAG: hypothetical protein J3K34DRAFT_403981 [Monoraphidium minutum]|nr:MAG: hypothetical protein J3K34DRAFT_403981 [Monoraphidium minutum]